MNGADHFSAAQLIGYVRSIIVHFVVLACVAIFLAAVAIPLVVLLFPFLLAYVVIIAWIQSQGKFARLEVVVAATLVGAACFYFIHNAYPKGGFIRDLLGITTVTLVGIIVSRAMGKESQRRYLLTLSAVAAIMFITVFALKHSLKYILGRMLFIV